MNWLVKILEACWEQSFNNFCRKMQARVDAATEGQPEPVLTLDYSPGQTLPAPEPGEGPATNGRNRKTRV